MTCENRSEQRSERGARSERDTLPQRNAEIAHREPEGETAHAPQRTIKYGETGGARILNEQIEQITAGGYGQQSAEQRQQQPCENALHNPVTLPTPVFYFIDGYVRR